MFFFLKVSKYYTQPLSEQPIWGEKHVKSKFCFCVSGTVRNLLAQRQHRLILFICPFPKSMVVPNEFLLGGLPCPWKLRTEVKLAKNPENIEWTSYDCAQFPTHRQDPSPALLARDAAVSPVIVPLIINPKRQRRDCWHRLNAPLWFAAATEDCYVLNKEQKKRKHTKNVSLS